MRRFDHLIVRCSDWESFCRKLEHLSSKDQGSAFERLTQLYLRSHPEYRSLLKHVWRIPEVPSGIRTRLHLPLTDEGIDLIAETYGGKFWAIQCKYRSDCRERLTYTELSTFTT